MQLFLLLCAAILSVGVLVLALLFLFSRISKAAYTAASSGIAVALIFTLFHFVYLYLKKGTDAR